MMTTGTSVTLFNLQPGDVLDITEKFYFIVEVRRSEGFILISGLINGEFHRSRIEDFMTDYVSYDVIR